MTASAVEAGKRADALRGTTTREEVEAAVESESVGARISSVSAMDMGESVLEEHFRTTRTGESDVEGRATQSMIPLRKDDILRGVAGVAEIVSIMFEQVLEMNIRR